MPIIAIALVLAAALGGGVSVAANQSLPGDTLYSFKTHVNENLESAFLVTGEARANFDINTAEERLEEAQKLAASGKLDAQAQAQINANFDQHAKEASDEISALEKNGDYDAAANVAAHFQSVLADHASTMTQASAQGDATVKASLDPLTVKVRAVLEQASILSTSASAKASTKTETQDGTNTSSSVQGQMKTNGGTTTTQYNADGSVKVNIF